MPLLDVLVPKSDDSPPLTNGVAKASAIVALPFSDNYRKVYFEGNAYGAVNLHHFSERLMVAASRLLHRAPTTAFFVQHQQDDTLLKVATYDSETRVIHPIDCPRLDHWIKSYEKSPNTALLSHQKANLLLTTTYISANIILSPQRHSP